MGRFSEFMDDAAPRANMALQFGVEQSPDEAAESVKLARRYKLPPAVVSEFRDEYQLKAKADDAKAAIAGAPRLQGWLAFDDHNARMAHDDVGNLAQIEENVRRFGEVKATRGPDASLSSISKGIAANLPQGFRLMSEGISLQISDLFDALGFEPDPELKAQRMRRMAQEQSRVQDSTPEFETATARGLYSGGASLVRQIPGLAAAIATRSTAPMLATTGLQVEAEAYGKYRTRGASPGEALVGGVGEAAVEVATEKLPMGFIVDRFGKTGAKQFLAGMLAREVPSEQVATVLQDAIDTAIANPDKTWAEYFAERPGAAYETLLATMVQSGVMGVANSVATKLAGPQAQAERADSDALLIDQVRALSEASALRGRDATTFRDFVAQVADEEGDAPVEMFIDGKTLANSLAQSGVTIEEFAAVAPAAARQIDNAVITGSDVRISVSEFATAGDVITAPLVDHLRTSAEGMSRSEAKQFLTEKGPQLEAEVRAALERQAVRQAQDASVSEVRSHFERELAAVGRFTPEVNKAYASLLTSFYTTQAQRAGMTPAALLDRYKLRISGEQPAGRALEQGREDIQRGALSFAQDITSQASVISLMKAADWSTVLHESGHFTLEVQADLARRIQQGISAGEMVAEGERGIVADMERILDWFGIKGTENTTALDEWLGMSLEQKREFHERWARGFEAYAFEGKAPSLELKAIFQRFRAWLVSIYRNLTALDVTLTDDVRDVMGRMLASDAAIEEAEAAYQMGPLFRDAESAGMTKDEFDAYQATGQRATAEAQGAMSARRVADLKWLSRATDKALKARQAEVDALRKEVEREARAEVLSRPVYRAWAFLTGKIDQVAPGEQAIDAIDTTAQSGRLRTSVLQDWYGSEADAVWRTLSERRMTSEDRGMHPDLVAEIFGYESGDALVRAIAAAAPPAETVQTLTDQRMLERHGDITSPEALAEAATAAVHNEFRARVIARELKALQGLGKSRETDEAMSLYTKRTVDVVARAAQDYAEQVIARLKVRDVRPDQYTAAETRNAKQAEKAFSAGKVDEAAQHKRNQLMNNLAAKVALETKAEIAKAIEFFRRVNAGTPETIAKTRDVDIVQAARAVLAAYGLGTRGESATTYLETLQRNDPAMYESVRAPVEAALANAKPYKELTVEEFRALNDEIRGLWHLAKRSRQVDVDGQLVAREQIQAELVARMEEIGIPAGGPGEASAITPAEVRLTKFQSALAALRRVESWVQLKDGAPMGPFRRYVWQTVKDAADAYRADRAKFLKQYRDLLQAIAPTLKRRTIAAPELGYTFGLDQGGVGLSEVLHAMAHTGNESNKRKLLLGRGWANERPDGTLDTTRWDRFMQRMADEGVVTKAHWDFVQGVWDMLEATKAQAQKTHRDVFGRYFAEVTAEPVATPFGTYRGGYVPAQTDARIVRDAATRALAEAENASMQFAFPTTSKGFTKARVECSRPLLLDLRSLAQHIDKVMLFSHLEQPVRDVRKVLTSKEVSAALGKLDPVAFDGILTPWLNRAARQQVEAPIPGDGGLMRFFSALRGRAGMAAMFANVSNTAQQITGFSMAAVKVKPKYLLSAMADWTKGPRALVKAVAEASPYMAQRMENEVHLMSGEIQDILLNPSVYESTKNWTAKHAYFMQSAVDNVMSPIIWIAARNQALEQGLSDRDASRLADSAVRETQGSSLAEDVSRMETGNAFVRLFTQFAGYFNMQANLLGTEFAAVSRDLGLRKGAGRAFYVLLLGFLVPAWTAEAIAQVFRGGPEDEDKDGEYLDDWLASVFLFGTIRNGLAMAPVVGPTANAAMNAMNSKPYDDRISTSPAISMIESAVKAPVSIYEAIAEDGKSSKAIRDLATLVSMVTGIPVTALARPAAYGADVAEDRIEPTGPIDAARGVVTGKASPASKE